MRDHPEYAALEEVAEMFRALSDPARLNTLVILSQKDRSVGELSEIENEKIGTVSARLKVLLHARLVRRRREGRFSIYAIADLHVMNLIENAIEHAHEPH